MCYNNSMLLDEYKIDIVDSGLVRKEFAGTYIIQETNEAAIVEISTTHAIPAILKRLNELSIKKEDVKYLFITHIHLDHASGCGALLKNLPNAKLVLHPTGAKHMVNPERLIQGAIEVYGAEVVAEDYGSIEPVAQERIIECKDGEIFTLGNRELTTIYTPGHARHHISIYDSKSRGIFSGDSLGLAYPELNVNKNRFCQPTTSPAAFEFDKMMESIDKMYLYNPEIIFFTHYGYSKDPLSVKNQIKRRLNDYIDLLNKDFAQIEENLSDYYIHECKNSGIKLSTETLLDLFNIDIKLNAKGLKIWKSRQ